MTHRVVFSPAALQRLTELFQYIALDASSEVAACYTEGIVGYCESLCTFPLRGTRRDDIRPGLRITHYKRRSVIAFEVTDDQVSIIGIFYGGQDYEGILGDDSGPEP